MWRESNTSKSIPPQFISTLNRFPLYTKKRYFCVILIPSTDSTTCASSSAWCIVIKSPSLQFLCVHNYKRIKYTYVKCKIVQVTTCCIVIKSSPSSSSFTLNCSIITIIITTKIEKRSFKYTNDKSTYL